MLCFPPSLRFVASPPTAAQRIGNLQSLPGELMYGVQVDQDINCRTFGRCVHGAEIDREILEAGPRAE